MFLSNNPSSGGYKFVEFVLLMFKCNEHVEMNKYLCSLACTWVTIIDSQFYIIDSLSLDVSWNEMRTWSLPGCIFLGNSSFLYFRYEERVRS